MDTRHRSAKEDAIQWAREMLERDTIIVDFETTGIRDAEIVQIGMIDTQGNVLMDTLVKPTRRIPMDVIRIHGITNEMVKDSRGFPEVLEEFAEILTPKIAVGYNVSYEQGVLKGELLRHRLTSIAPVEWTCAMKAYARYHGTWNPKYRSYKWHSLSNACTQQQIVVENAHQALGDCLMTLELIRKMAQS
jgi:DNA polymerase-3 subunit epsilon